MTFQQGQQGQLAEQQPSWPALLPAPLLTAVTTALSIPGNMPVQQFQGLPLPDCTHNRTV
jgi:hypothetical protein